MRNHKIKRMVGVAILSAIVVILQLLGRFIYLGPMVSVSLVLIPIVVGAAIYGPSAGAILGAVFSIVVLLQPDTVFFYGVDFFGTLITVLLKGIFAGLTSGLVFNALKSSSQLLAIFIAAIICPLVNTGVFFLGCRVFFWEALTEVSGGNAFQYVITVMIGFNFIAEFVTNVICVPLVERVLHAVSRVK